MRCHHCAALLGVLLLNACATPEPAGNWIEVPLREGTFWQQGEGFKTGSYDIPIPAGGELEYQVALQEGAMIVYRWDVAMTDSSLLKVEFHGHTERVGDAPGTLIYYKVHSEGRESGAMKAPFTGIHGWYFNNTSGEAVVVKLQMAGVYTETE